MGKDRKYQDRLEVVLRQLEEDLTIVHVSIEELQDKDYRRALRWSGSVIWRKADRHLSATLKRQELTLERFQHAVGSAGRDLDALVPMPGGVSRTRMTFAKRAESAWWSVRSREHEVEELIGAVMNEYGNRHPRLERCLARSQKLLHHWEVAGPQETDMEDCKQVQYHLEDLLEEWQENEPASHRNKDKRKETRGAIKCLKNMQECGPGCLYSDWDRSVNTATTSSRKSSRTRKEHEEHHKEGPAERSRSTKSSRTTRPPGSSERDSSRTTRGRPPKPTHLRFQKTKSGQIYGESLFGWSRRTWKTQWLY